MPAFIKTPRDEARWAKAKKHAAKSKKKDEGSFTDQDWGLVNHIYQNMDKMEKGFVAEELAEILEKAKNRMSDEEPSDDEMDNQHLGDDNESFDATDGETQEDDEAPAEKASSQKEPKKVNKFKDPEGDRLKNLKDVAGHWLNHADQIRKMSADAKKNPHLFAEGHRIAAHNAAHEDFNSAHHAFINSDDYKKMSPTQKMRAEIKFKKEFQEKNPDMHSKAINAVSEAHTMHDKAKLAHKQEKDNKRAHVMMGGQGGGETFSGQEAAQHVGGSKDEEGGYTSSVVQDPAASFAGKNRDYLATLEKPKTVEDYEELESPEMKTIKHPALNDPKNKQLLNEFFKEYHPLISSNVSRARKQAEAMGLPEDSVDASALHEAGMHGLMQALKDYNPEVGSFKSHASGKMSGLMQSHLASHDPVNREDRAAAKFHEKTKSSAPVQTPTSPAPVAVTAPVQPEAPKVDIHKVISTSGHPAAAEMADRAKRVHVQKVITRKGKV